MTLTTGQTLQNRYRVVSPLGQGGMGAVYRAWDTRLNISVALKEMIPQPGLAPDVLAQLRQQFQQEAVVLARLDHPHLVNVTDFFEEEGNAYLVMQFVGGENLAQRIERQGVLPEEIVLIWAEQLLDALAYCHSQGVIHRDVKPQNVIIRPDGRAVLVDFGLVKLWDPSDPRTKTAMRGMGTPEYAPPEQYDIQMGHTDPRSDVYSLGATLYHALTGQAPPTVTQRIATRRAFQQPRTLNQRISPATEAAILRAMELTVEDRFATAQEMAAALGGQAPAPPHPTAVPQRQRTKVMPGAQPAAPPRRRVPGWVWMVGGIILLALVAGAAAVGAGLMMASRGVSGDSTPTLMPSPTQAATLAHTPTLAPTSTPTRTPTQAAPETALPTSTSVRTPTAEATATAQPSPTATPRPSPAATSTPAPPTRTPLPPTQPPSPTPTELPPPTEGPPPEPGAGPELVGPANGGEYQNPITFEWHASSGQTYQVTARHTASGHTVRSGLIEVGIMLVPYWTTNLPADKPGEWRWTVSVIQGGSAVATSAEWMFQFRP
jgi:serine/threonine protein kinase